MKKKIISLLLALIMALSLLPVSVLAAGADVPAPSAENGFVDEIYFPVSGSKTQKDTNLERIKDFTFQQDRATYENIILPDLVPGSNGMVSAAGAANWIGISIPEEYVGASAEKKLYYRVYLDGKIVSEKSYAPLSSKSITRVNSLIGFVYTGLNKISVGKWSTLIVQVGTVNEEKTAFVKSDVYKFEITRQPSLHAVTAKVGENKLDISPTPELIDNPYVRDYSVITTADKVTLNIKGSTGAKLYIGEDVVNGGEDTAIVLSKYKETSDAKFAVIPITVKVSGTGETGLTKETTYRLFVSEKDYTPTIKAQPKDITVDKMQNTTLAVEAEAVGNGTLTYQWYEKVSARDSVAIQGATDSTYAAPNIFADARTYFCIVTNTVDGVPFVATSEAATVTVKLSSLTAPQFYYPMELEGNGGSRIFTQNGKPTFKVSVGAESGLADQADGLNLKVSIYKTDKKEAVGGELQAESSISNGGYGKNPYLLY